MRMEGHFGEGLLHAWHASDADFAVAQLEVVRVGLHHVRSDTDQLLPELLCCPDDGAGEHDGKAAAAGPGAIEAVITVAVRNDDVLGIDLQLFGENLSRDGLRAISPERRLQCDIDLAGRVHLQRHALRRAGQCEPGAFVEHPELSQVATAMPIGWRVGWPRQTDDLYLLCRGGFQEPGSSPGGRLGRALQPYFA